MTHKANIEYTLGLINKCYHENYTLLICVDGKCRLNNVDSQIGKYTEFETDSIESMNIYVHGMASGYDYGAAYMADYIKEHSA